jgi:hypothetical protein
MRGDEMGFGAAREERPSKAVKVLFRNICNIFSGFRNGPKSFLYLLMQSNFSRIKTRQIGKFVFGSLQIAKRTN